MFRFVGYVCRLFITFGFVAFLAIALTFLAICGGIYWFLLGIFSLSAKKPSKSS